MIYFIRVTPNTILVTASSVWILNRFIPDHGGDIVAHVRDIDGHKMFGVDMKASSADSSKRRSYRWQCIISARSALKLMSLRRFPVLINRQLIIQDQKERNLSTVNASRQQSGSDAPLFTNPRCNLLQGHERSLRRDVTRKAWQQSLRKSSWRLESRRYSISGWKGMIVRLVEASLAVAPQSTRGVRKAISSRVSDSPSAAITRASPVVP